MFKSLILEKIALSLATILTIFILLVWFIKFQCVLHFNQILLLLKSYSNIRTTDRLLRRSTQILIINSCFLFCYWKAGNKLRRSNLSDGRAIIFHRLLILLIFVSKVLTQPVKVLCAWKLFVKHRHKRVKHFRGYIFVYIFILTIVHNFLFKNTVIWIYDCTIKT